MTEFGCDSIVTYNVQFAEPSTCGLDIVMANIFSPNGDMINDTWAPSFRQVPVDYEIEVYDRWGKLVFQSIDLSDTWDGQLNGRVSDAGVYIYSIKADGLYYRGDITLIR